MSPTSPAGRVEETGPVFFDEEDEREAAAGRGGDALPELRPRTEGSTGTVPGDASPSSPASSASPASPSSPSSPSSRAGSTPAASTPSEARGGAPSWQADTARQSGFGPQSDDAVSWGSPEDARPDDPRGNWRGSRTDEPGRPGAAESGAADDGAPPVSSSPSRQAVPGQAQGSSDPHREHTVGLRRSEVLRSGNSPAAPVAGASSQAQAQAQAQAQEQEQAVRDQEQASAPAQRPGQALPVQAQPRQGQPVQAQPQSQSQPGQRVPGQASPAHGAGTLPVPDPAPQAGPPPWAQQVQELAAPAAASAAPAAPSAPHVPSASAQDAGAPGLPAQPQSGGPDAVTPWRPPANDPFAHAAQQARPAGLGRRLAARLLDLVLTLAVAGAITFPFVGKATDHIRDKVDAVEQAGETKQVWLLDGTTGAYLGLVLGVLLLFGLLYEVLPTARWGRTPGKKLFGVVALDLESQQPPTFGAALLRWLTYGVLGVLAVGIVNLVWCVFDRPWRQCWHDKAARTYVARNGGSGRPGL